MASTSQTPAHIAHSVSAPAQYTGLPLTSAPTQRPSSASPQPALLPNAPSKAVKSSLANQFPSPTIELTGAGATKDNQRHQKSTEPQFAPFTTPNPQRNPFMDGPSQPMSRPGDAPGQQSMSSTQRAQPVTNHTSASGSSLQISVPRSTHNASQSEQPKSAEKSTNQPSPKNRRTSKVPNAEAEANMFASPEPVDRQEEGTPASQDTASRKRRLSPSPTTQAGPTFSTYPPISTSATQAPRNASLPNSGANKSGSGKKHKCPHCATEFTRHHNLKSHLLTHSHEKPFGCEQCDARFRRLHDLKRHVKLHTGERPHQCDVCGRAFARGDALARHSKGPGGCAGRRESGVGDEDMDGEGDEDDEDEQSQPDGLRRKSEPNKRARRESGRLSDGQTSSHGRTYPPVAPRTGQTQSLYPGGSGQTPTSNHPNGLSPHQHRSSMAGFTVPQYQTPSMYAQGNVTESPRPLSPGQPESNRRASEMGRSPSISTRMQQQGMLRGSIGGHGSTSGNVPTTHQHVPSVQVDGRYPHQHNQRLPPPSVQTTGPLSNHSGPPSAGPTSASSHHQSSGGSMRELYGAAPNGQQGGSFSSQMTGQNSSNSDMLRILENMSESNRSRENECNDLKHKLSAVSEQRARDNEAYQRMADENQMLRSQLAQMQGGR